MNRNFIVILVFLISLSEAYGADHKPQVHVNAYVDRGELSIGDQIKCIVEVDTDQKIQVQMPSHESDFGGLRVIDFGDDPAKYVGQDQLRYVRWFKLDTFVAGSYVIAPLSIRYTNALGEEKIIKSQEIFVEVKSVLGNVDASTDIKDIKDPLSLMRSWPHWSWILIGFLLFILISLWLFKRRLKVQKTQQIAPPDPAYKIAFSELDRIESLKLLQKRLFKEFYYLVTQCFRIFIENQYFIRAPEQTTEEFLEQIQSSLNARDQKLLREYLVHCDLVKYAKLDPNFNEASQIIHTARKFIQQSINDKNVQKNINESAIHS